MKSKSISFAEVLRKNIKSPRVEATKTSMSLQEMMRRFEADPEDDYTLYLGNFNASHKSKPSSFQMTFSRNTVENQDEMFDSWIQKQSAVGSNKENIRNQPQRSARNQPAKRSMGVFAKNITHSKTRQDVYPTNSATSHRQRDSKTIEESQRNFVPLNIEMIKSNGYQSQKKIINQAKSPKTQKRFMPTQPVPINMDMDRPKNNVFERPSQIKVEPTFKEIKQSKESQKANSQFIKLPQKSNEYISYPKEQPKANQYISYPKEPPSSNFQNQKIKQQINDITSKYLNVQYSPEGQAEDEDLLLQNQNTQKTEIFNENYAKKSQLNDDIMKKRMEDAKNLIGNYMDKFKKQKQQTQIELKYDTYLTNPHFQTSNNQANTQNHMVGYSFSTNFMGVNQSSQNQPIHHQNYIPDVVSQAASETQQLQNDSNFKNKYLNMNSYEEIEHNQHIPNIQSVKYNRDDYQQSAFEHERLYGIPNDTYKVHLITSKENQNTKKQEKFQYNLIENQLPVRTYKEAPIENKITQSFESNLLESEGTKAKTSGKSKQKISLISSKSRHQRSNKASPTITNQPEKQPDVATTDFALDIPKEVKSPGKDFLKHNEKSYDQSYTKTEEKMSYGIKKEEQHQYTFKDNDVPKETKMSITGNYGLTTYPVQQPEKILSTNVTEYKPVQQKKAEEYVAPTYAKTKTASKLAQITSDYYSTSNYTNYAPSYETGKLYEAPTYENTAKTHFISSKTYEQLPLKAESSYAYDLPKEEQKKENIYAMPTSYVPSSNSYQQKYAIPTSYASNTDKEINKSYLQKLDIKESITFQESKAKPESVTVTNPLKSSNSNNYIHTFASNIKQFKTVNPVTNPRVSLKLSLKQSINVSQSQEFVFDI